MSDYFSGLDFINDDLDVVGAEGVMLWRRSANGLADRGEGTNTCK
jgi:hypothetical protein